MKICPGCKEERDDTYFTGGYIKSDGSKVPFQHRCKICRRAASLKHYYANRDKSQKLSQLWKENNKEKCIKTSKIWRENNVEEIKKRKEGNKGRANSYESKRRASKLKQTPTWVTKEELHKISLLYEEARRLTVETGIIYHVDHYYPLKSNRGMGLHCLANLRIITASENFYKSNKWPE